VGKGFFVVSAERVVVRDNTPGGWRGSMNNGRYEDGRGT